MPIINNTKQELTELLASQAPMVLEGSQERVAGQNPRMVRREGFIPATLYGNVEAPVSFQLPVKEFTLAYRRGQRVFTVPHLNGLQVVAKQVSYHTLSHAIENIEFQVL
ncbi:MAG: hypothetical protein ACKO37_03820 [Vampirovibrionales bacterium]